MYYKQKKDTFIRNYDGTGYIKSTGLFNDRTTNESGAVFLDALSRKPQTLDGLAEKIIQKFTDADIETIKKDAAEFYDMLVTDGFLTKGKTAQEAIDADKGFTYGVVQPKTIREDFTPEIQRADKDTQSELQEHFKGKPHLTSFQIELTSRCNERCIHCYIPHKYKLYNIDPKLYYKVLGELKEMGVLSVTLSGGEPMMHPQFKEFLLAAKEYDFYVNVLSNLTLVDDEIVRAMKDITMSSVQVSLYSMNPAVHDEITQLPGSFEKTKAAILKLIENDIAVQISCPTMKQNKDDYGEVLRWAHEHKIRAVTDYIMMARYDHSTDNLDNRLSLDEVGKVIKDIMKDDVDYQAEILKPDFEERCNSIITNPDQQVCGIGISSCCMVANGNIYPCAGWQDYICGNVAEDTLMNIWENSPKMQWLRNVRKKDFPECVSCKDKAFCAMCMVRNSNESATANPLEINRHFCKVAALNKKIVLDWRKEELERLLKNQACN